MNPDEREEGGKGVGGDTPPLQQPLQRLQRLDRTFHRHPLYFVTACTEKRRSLLANDQVHADFQKFCQTGLERGVFVGRYVLMPDHLHLFVAFGDEYEASLIKARFRRSQTGATEGMALTHRHDSGEPVAVVCDRRLWLLSEWMKSLKNSLSKTLREMNVSAPHWQKGFFDHVMRSEESYSEKWLYVAENPIRKNLVSGISDWPYQGEIYQIETRGHV